MKSHFQLFLQISSLCPDKHVSFWPQVPVLTEGAISHKELFTYLHSGSVRVGFATLSLVIPINFL